MTISHLRFGPRPIRSAYLIRQASFVACHQFEFLDRFDVLEHARGRRASSCSTRPSAADEVWDHLPREVQEQIIDKRLQLYAIDASAVAREAGMGGRINTIMQTCFFAISGVLPRDEAIEQIKKAIEKTYGKRGRRRSSGELRGGRRDARPPARGRRAGDGHRDARAVRRSSRREAPDFVQRVTAVMLAGKGDLLPVSAFPVDGTWPAGTAKWEKRNIAVEIPVWDRSVCIQCNKCALVCPHAAIRAKVYDPAALGDAPATFKSTAYKGHEFKGQATRSRSRPRTAPAASSASTVCPAKDKTNPRHKAIDMAPAGAAARGGARQLRVLPRPARARSRPTVKRRSSRARSSSSRCSSTRAPAPAAARRRTSSC